MCNFYSKRTRLIGCSHGTNFREHKLCVCDHLTERHLNIIRVHRFQVVPIRPYDMSVYQIYYYIAREQIYL